MFIHKSKFPHLSMKIPELGSSCQNPSIRTCIRNSCLSFYALLLCPIQLVPLCIRPVYGSFQQDLGSEKANNYECEIGKTVTKCASASRSGKIHVNSTKVKNTCLNY